MSSVVVGTAGDGTALVLTGHNDGTVRGWQTGGGPHPAVTAGPDSLPGLITSTDERVLSVGSERPGTAPPWS